jgi:hypothetical protein
MTFHSALGPERFMRLKGSAEEVLRPAEAQGSTLVGADPPTLPRRVPARTRHGDPSVSQVRGSLPA